LEFAAARFAKQELHALATLRADRGRGVLGHGKLALDQARALPNSQSPITAEDGAVIKTASFGEFNLSARYRTPESNYGLSLRMRSISYSASWIATARLTGVTPDLLLPSSSLISHRQTLSSVNWTTEYSIPLYSISFPADARSRA
jgi:hypothetical protein